MNTTKLPQKWIDKLVELPESGMGYQIVTISFSNGKHIKSVVLNCSEIAGELGEYTVDDIEDIVVMPRKQLYAEDICFLKSPV